MKTIQEAKDAKKQMEEKIADAIRAFEAEYGDDAVTGFRIRRWNGSNEAFGKVSRIEASVSLC